MQSPGTDQVRIPGLMQIIGRRKKKGDKKMAVKFGEFFDTSEKTFQFGENVESLENYPLYVAPYYGGNMQVHVRNQAETKIFAEDGKPIEGFDVPQTDEAVLEVFILSEEDAADAELNTLVYDAALIDGEDMSEMPFSERYERLIALAEEDDSFIPIQWKRVENFEEFSEYAGSIVENEILGIRVKRADSKFGEEVFVSLGEDENEDEDETLEKMVEEEEPFVPVQQ